MKTTEEKLAEIELIRESSELIETIDNEDGSITEDRTRLENGDQFFLNINENGEDWIIIIQ